MRNRSSGWSSWVDIDGSAVKMGRRIGSRSRNLAYKGSRLNSAFLRYTSPIDLDICNIIWKIEKYNPHVKCCLFFKSIYLNLSKISTCRHFDLVN